MKWWPFKLRINFGEIQRRLVKARQEERDRVTKELMEKFSREKQLIEKEHTLEIIEKNAEIKSLKDTIQRQQDTVFLAEEIYIQSVNMSTQSRRVLSDMVAFAEQGLHVNALQYQSMKKLAEEAKDQETMILSEFESNKKRLRGDGK